MRFHGQKLSLPQRQTYHPSPNDTLWYVRDVFQRG